MESNQYTFVEANNSQTAEIKTVVFSVLKEYGLQPSTIDFCLEDIEKHYFQEFGGFSYYLNKSQTHYYGIKITDGIKEPDIHGTTLLVWSLSMIFEVLGDPYPKWNIIKP